MCYIKKADGSDMMPGCAALRMLLAMTCCPAVLLALRKLSAVTCCPDVMNQERCTTVEMCSVVMCLRRTAMTLYMTCLSADLSNPELTGLLLSSSLALYLDIMQQQVPLAYSAYTSSMLSLTNAG